MASSKPALLGEVVAERIDLRVRLYRVSGVYRLRFAGLGWHPESWRDERLAWAKLLGCVSYGTDELAMVRGQCRAEL